MKRLLNNIGMKLASVLIAFLIWLVVVTINDPEQTRAFPNVRVTIRNSDAILNADKAFDVAERGYDDGLYPGAQFRPGFDQQQ